MRLTGFLYSSAIMLLPFCAAAQSPKSDACATPPGTVAPSIPAKLLTGQGKVHFPITTRSELAQAFFNQGVAQMHSFWAREAERSFLQAAALDPTAPMPWWGVAMVSAGDYRPRFQLETYGDQLRLEKKKWPERTLEAVNRARKLASENPVTELEKLYIDSVAARRDAPLPNPEETYTDKLRHLVGLYPNEVEARLYLALHLMRGYALPEKSPRSTTMEAVAILRDLMKQAPDHPGVHHYVIHGWEGSTFAKEAWLSCEKYPELVPNIPHAQHMPGHIYSQTGRWQDASKSFNAAAANERYWLKEDSLASSQHHGHNVQYLATVHSFQGNYAEAMKAAHELLGYAENPREAATTDLPRITWRQGWFSLMRTIVQNERWDDLEQLPVHDKPRSLAWRAWAQGIAAAAKANPKEAAHQLSQMDAALGNLRKELQTIPEELRVARQELQGQVLISKDELEKGLAELKAAANAERRLIYSEPPFYPRPVAESLGRISLNRGRLELAEWAFREALVMYPGSLHAEKGLAEVLRRTSKSVSSLGGN